MPKLRENLGFYVWIALLLVLIVGAGVGVYQDRVHEAANLSDEIPWGLWIMIDISASAIGAGALALVALVYIFGLKRFEPLARVALLVGFLGYTSAALSLMADLGRPDRFWHSIVYWNIRSPLWAVTWSVILCTISAMVGLAPAVLESPLFSTRAIFRRLITLTRGVAPILGACAAVLSLLHQAAVGISYGVIKARPIWFKPSLPIIVAVMALSAGPAFTIALTAITSRIKRQDVVKPALLQEAARMTGLVIVAGLFIRLWDLAATTYYSPLPILVEETNLLYAKTPYELGLFVGEVIIGSIVPALILLNPNLNRRSRNLVLAGVLSTFGLFLNRWNTTLTGLVATTSYSPSDPGVIFTPYFPALAEWLVAFGIAAYAALIYTLAVRFLPIFGTEEQDTVEHATGSASIPAAAT
jgi:Ni/Fe-hydrogenase subunit HybB-like protein